MINLFHKRKKIDFIIGGTQKGGTTALDYYLRKHKQIGMAKKKELHFFDNDTLFSNSNIDYSIYEKNFNFFLNKKVYGETTPIYMYWEPSCKRIYDYNPDIKLIFILRNPISRAFSHWNMEFDRRKSYNESFSFAIRNECENNLIENHIQNRMYSYVDRGFYFRQIKRIKNYFDERQILFIKYEDFKKNQRKTLFEIFTFLGVDSAYNFKEKQIHTRKKHSEISIDDKKYLIKQFKFDIYNVEKELNWDCSDWLT